MNVNMPDTTSSPTSNNATIASTQTGMTLSFSNAILKREHLRGDEDERSVNKKPRTLPILQEEIKGAVENPPACFFFDPPHTEFQPDKELTVEDEAMAAKIGSFVANKIDKLHNLRKSMHEDLKNSKDFRTKFKYMKEESEYICDDEDYEKFAKDFENFEVIGTKYEHLRYLWDIDEIREKMIDGSWDKFYLEDEEFANDDDDDDKDVKNTDGHSSVQMEEQPSASDVEQWGKERIAWFIKYTKVYMTNAEKCQLYCPFSDNEWAVNWNEKLGLPCAKHLHGFGRKFHAQSTCDSQRNFLPEGNGVNLTNNCKCAKCNSFYNIRTTSRIGRSNNTLKNHLWDETRDSFCLMHWGLTEVMDKVGDYFNVDEE